MKEDSDWEGSMVPESLRKLTESMSLFHRPIGEVKLLTADLSDKNLVWEKWRYFQLLCSPQFEGKDRRNPQFKGIDNMHNLLTDEITRRGLLLNGNYFRDLGKDCPYTPSNWNIEKSVSDEVRGER